MLSMGVDLGGCLLALLPDLRDCAKDCEPKRDHQKDRNPVRGIPSNDRLFSHLAPFETGSDPPPLSGLKSEPDGISR